MTTAWLEALEEKVHAASTRLRELREDNAQLRTRVEELEAKLGEAEAAQADTKGWSKERDGIRKRVGALVEHLEGLLDDDNS